MALTPAQRTELQNRFMTNQSAKSIAKTMAIHPRTVYRLKRKWVQPDGSYRYCFKTTPKTDYRWTAITGSVRDNPKISLRELREKSIDDGIFDSSASAPDKSTIFRRLKTLGYVWKRARFEDPRAKRSVIQYERCAFRQAQHVAEANRPRDDSEYG